MPSSAVQAPKQARSAETLERLLDAAEELLEGQSFDDTSVAEIAARARVTIGAVYARFPDKDAVLRKLEERMTKDFLELVDQELGPRRMTAAALEDFVLEHHRRLVGVYRKRRAIARALVLRSHTDAAVKRRLEALNATNIPRVAQIVLKRATVKHPTPDRAVAFAVLAVRSVCREVVLFREGWPGYKPPSDDVLAQELTRMFFGYLGIPARSL